MADATHIEWTDATWNVVTGCSVVSPGCTNCYAMKLAGTRLKHHPSRAGLTIDTKAGPVWNGQVRFNAEWLDQPLRWTRPRRIFVAAHGDLFHDGVTDDHLDQIFAVMALCPQHTFQILTKRPERMRAYLTAFEWDRMSRTCLDTPAGLAALRAAPAPVSRRWPLPNVWLGVSAEDQTRADERIPILLDTPAAVRWLSAEPLLGPIDLHAAWHGESAVDSECWGDCGWCSTGHPPLHNCQKQRQDDASVMKGRSGLDWVVSGGESGPDARPMHPAWARQLRDQCAEAGVPFLFKQWGAWRPSVDQDYPDDTYTIAWPNRELGSGAATTHGGLGQSLSRVGKKAAGRLLDGVQHDGYPETRS